MNNAFIPVFAFKAGDERSDPLEGIRRGNIALQGRILIASKLEQQGIPEKWKELVAYVIARDCPREPDQRGAPTATGFALRANAFMEELRRIASEDTKT